MLGAPGVGELGGGTLAGIGRLTGVSRAAGLPELAETVDVGVAGEAGAAAGVPGLGGGGVAGDGEANGVELAGCVGASEAGAAGVEAGVNGGCSMLPIPKGGRRGIRGVRRSVSAPAAGRPGATGNAEGVGGTMGALLSAKRALGEASGGTMRRGGIGVEGGAEPSEFRSGKRGSEGLAETAALASVPAALAVGVCTVPFWPGFTPPSGRSLACSAARLGSAVRGASGC